MNDSELDYNRRNIEEFRSSGGKLASFGDAPVLLLTTKGAKSGEHRTAPAMYLADDEDPNRVYVFASRGGDDRNPAWFHNVLAHPDDVTVEIGTETLAAHAEPLAEPDRTRVFDVQAGRYSAFADYQAKTSRTIPVVALDVRR